jgi:hypothetical protein
MYPYRQRSGISLILKENELIGEDFTDYNKDAHWWVEMNPVVIGNWLTCAPIDPVIGFYSDIDLSGCQNMAGPFHCKACAETAVNFGKTPEQAWEFNHGADDEKFGVFLSAG